MVLNYIYAEVIIHFYYLLEHIDLKMKTEVWSLYKSMQIIAEMGKKVNLKKL